MKQNNMKETILSAATDLIIKQGVKNTSLADIAKASNISKGTLYYHYSSKNDLICAIADMHLEVITKAVLDCVHGIGTDDSSINMVNLIMEKISSIEGRGRIHMYLLCEAITENDTLKESIKVKYFEWRNTLKQEISKTVKYNKDAEALSFLLVSVVDGLVVQGLLKSVRICQSPEKKELLTEAIPEQSRGQILHWKNFGKSLV